ncbi:hypothetical protein KOW79_020136 [Hemibagrus wyckioides]|uniref:Uncharacterized protein n=1 Tax=Hemibagrus wyckioides TaxID=337641 RepID=A0A9D3SAM1_9TELE|nr:hypothetical protein KOW79_020136 [Hemibagrus wyckioides]
MAKQDEQPCEKEEKKAAMLKSIAEHREALQKELKYKKQEEKQNAAEMLHSSKATDLLFLRKHQVKDQKKKPLTESDGFSKIATS